MKKNTKVKKTKEEIQFEKEQRWKQMRNLAKSFAKQAGIKVVKAIYPMNIPTLIAPSSKLIKKLTQAGINSQPVKCLIRAITPASTSCGKNTNKNKDNATPRIIEIVITIS